MSSVTIWPVGRKVPNHGGEMKNKNVAIVSILFVIVALGNGLTRGEEVTSSRITEVTLFTQGAQVTREAEISLRKGVNRILIELEASYVDTNSVSAKVFARGEVYSVQYRRIYLKEVPQEKLRKLKEKLQEMNAAKEKLTHSRQVLYKGREFLQSIVDFSKQEISEDIKTDLLKPEEAEKLLSFLMTSYSSSYTKEEDIEKKLKDINNEISLLKRQISELSGTSQKEKKVVEIVFNASRNTERTKVKVTYLVNEARWKPVYRAEVPSDLSRVNLVMMAKVSQKTGEDWKNVKLTVSNSYPWRGGNIPQPAPWLINYFPPSPRRKANLLYEVQSEEMDKASTAGAQHFGAKGTHPADFSYAQTKVFPLSFEYEFSQVVVIPSADKTTYLALTRKQMKGEFFYYTYPRVSPLVFLVCRVNTNEELLPGPINVYLEGRFLRQTVMSEKKAGVEFTLNLGTPKGVLVKRTKIKDEVKETFFRKIQRNTIIRKVEFKITIENIKDYPIKIRLLDNIPVSRTDKIEVKDVKLIPSPAQKDYQDQRGVNLWEFEIAPKKRQEVRISFTVTYPKDIPIYGL